MAEYDPPANDAVDFTMESYSQPGNAEVDFTIGEPEAEEPTTEQPSGPFRFDDTVELPLSLDLPLRPLNLRNMDTGLSVFLVGILAVLGGGAYVLRNWASMALLGLAVVALLMSGTIGVGLELFWAMLIAAVLLLTVGAVWRVTT